MSATSFAELGLRPEMLRAVDRSRLHHAHADPGAGHSRHPRRPRRHGRRPDRHRQDRRLRAADPAEAARRMANTSPSPARHPVRALILTPTRELAIQVEESIRTYGKYTNLRSTVRLRRRRHQAAAADRARRRRDPRRHAGPPARPHRAEERLPGPGRDLRARRGRPHARHGLHPGHQADHGAAAGHGEAAEPAVLGDVLQRDQEARRPAAERAAADRGRASATPPPRRSTQSAYKVPAGRQARAARAPRHARATCTQVLCFVRTKHGASRLARQLEKDGLVTDGDPRRQDAAGAHRGARPRSRKASCRCWSPPTSPRAASTSTTCRSSSTTSCRTCPRTTSTASAAPAARAPPARRSRSSRRKRRSIWPTSSGC